MKRFILTILCTTLLSSFAVHAANNVQPWSWSNAEKAAPADAPALKLVPVDQAARLQEDATTFSAQVAEHGAANKRLRVATDNHVDVDTSSAGRLRMLADGGVLWRLVVHANNATDLRFGFDRFAVPASVTLHVINPADHTFKGPFTVADNNQFGELWLPPVGGDTLVLELHVPPGVTIAPGSVHLAHVATGYRNTTARGGPELLGAGPSGTCNIDVVCPLGDPYRDDIRAVAKYYLQSGGGTYLCTGTLVNNTSGDLTPYFLTANHCVSTASEAGSMTLFWNYESPTCGQHGGDNQNDNTQTGGGTLVAHRSDVDFSLVRLNSTPDPSFNVYYAGWDASGVQPDGVIGIHHPSGWVKAITEDNNGITSMDSCIGGGNQTHWRTGAPYSQGTTEGGSSGSMIVVPSGDITGHDNLIIGTLSGGTAGCSGSAPNSGYDCYGKFSVAWDGSSAAQRLKDWLDPGATGATTLPGTNPGGGVGDPEISVTPASLSGTAEAGASSTESLSIGNTGTAMLSWSIDEAAGACSSPSSVTWLSVSPISGSTGIGGSSSITVTFDAAALSEGSFSANLCIDSNDPITAQVTVPVSLTVTPAPPSDAIFCSGFENGEDGSCAGTQPFVQPIEDPSFEATTSSGGSNPFWTGTDSNGSGTPFYENTTHTGSYGVWAGGYRRASTQTFSQSVTIASGGPRHLHYWRNVTVAPNTPATLTITVDGNVVETTDIAAIGVESGWGEHVVDVSSYADNASHLIKFSYEAGGTEDGNTYIDDVTIEETP